MQGNKAALIEVCGVFLAMAALTWLGSRVDFLPLVRDNLHLLVAALFVFTSIRCSERLPGGLPHYGIALGGLLVPDAEREAPGLLGAVVDLLRALLRAVPACLRELGVAVLVCAVVFPPFVAAYYFWHAPVRSFELIPHSELPAFVLTQIVVVGLPEEMLFRGYIQGRLEDVWPRKVRFLFTELSLPAWLVQAALFAVLHVVVEVHPARLAVFFPALLFGWLRSLRGGVGAAVFVHAFCNLLSDVLGRGWL
jgi:membrane protease YdiL (CAAX protease family)